MRSCPVSGLCLRTTAPIENAVVAFNRSLELSIPGLDLVEARVHSQMPVKTDAWLRLAGNRARLPGAS